MRLAHKMLQHGFTTPPNAEHAERFGAACLNAFRHGCPVLVADNVAEFFNERTKERHQWKRADYPACVPAFDEMFVEFSPGGKTIYGSLVNAVDAGRWLEHATHLTSDFRKRSEEAISKSRWVIEILPLFSSRRGVCLTCDVLGVWVSPQGDVMGAFQLASGWYGESQQIHALHSQSIITLLALSFCNCKNVVRRDATETEGPTRKWLKRTRMPELKYYTLEIEPMKQVLRTEGGLEHNGLKKALHICRGHFATYTDEKPLFGRSTGTFWKPAHVRGSAKEGVVVKDYAVKV